jgi:hypothetical protein
VWLGFRQDDPFRPSRWKYGSSFSCSPVPTALWMP